MKNIVLITILSFISFHVYPAQSDPDSWGYTWKDSNEPSGPEYGWFDIVNIPGSTQVKLLGDDNSCGPFLMNFNFHYYWYDVNQFYVGSNGYILFQQGQLASIFYNLPSTIVPNDIIGPFMNDISFEGDNNPAQCWYRVNDNYDTLIISWVDVPFWSPAIPGYSGSNSFQLILSAVDSSITFQYAVQQGSAYNQYTTRVGIENYSGSIGLSWNTVFPATINPPVNYAIKFYYPKNPTLQVTDASMSYNDNSTTGGIFLPVSNTPHILTAQAKNCGVVSANAFAVNVEVKNPVNSIVVNSTAFTDTLQPQQSQAMIFNDTFYPDTPGTYKFKTICELAGDSVVTNNSKTQEIVVIDTSQAEMRLRFDGAQAFGYQGVSWVGGYGSIAVYFIPPFYPVQITQLHYRNNGLSNNSTFAARVFDDDGAQGLPFTLLDSLYVLPADLVLNGWTHLTLSVPIIINSGGFYVSWDQQGESLYLNVSNAPPISYRSFEGNNTIFGIYRRNQVFDPMINVTIGHLPVIIGIPAINDQSLQLQLFPNPCSNTVNIVYRISENRTSSVIAIFDVRGKKVKEINPGTGGGMHQLSLDISELNNGIYFAELISGNKKAVQKLVVVK